MSEVGEQTRANQSQTLITALSEAIRDGKYELGQELLIVLKHTLTGSLNRTELYAALLTLQTLTRQLQVSQAQRQRQLRDHRQRTSGHRGYAEIEAIP